MIQSKKNGSDLYSIGCLGKIVDYKKNRDGRILINLSGITRFEIIEEIKNNKLYREFNVQYEKFEMDLSNISNKKDEFTVLNKLVNKTKNFFKKNGLLLNWQEFQKLTIDQQINTLSMIAPISNEEKQKLLETISTQDKIQTFSKIVEFYNYEKIEEKPTVQ